MATEPCPDTPLGGTPQDAVLEFHRRIDAGRARSALGLFETDATFQAQGRELVGRGAIAEFLAERERLTDRHTVHVCANAQVREEGGTATVTGHVLLFVRRPGDGGYDLERVLETEHLVRRGESGWLIARRLSRPLHPQS